MKGIERSLHKYITGAGPKVSIQEVSIYAVEHGDDLVDILFKCLNSVLNDYIGECSLQKNREKRPQAMYLPNTIILWLMKKVS